MKQHESIIFWWEPREKEGPKPNPLLTQLTNQLINSKLILIIFQYPNQFPNKSESTSKLIRINLQNKSHEYKIPLVILSNDLSLDHPFHTGFARTMFIIFSFVGMESSYNQRFDFKRRELMNELTATNKDQIRRKYRGQAFYLIKPARRSAYTFVTGNFNPTRH